MSAIPLSDPKFRAFNANGDPLAGGKLYSYAAGTSTPLSTYTTRAGTIANTNPVVLDANGEANVWTTEGVLYKFVLKDASSVIQWTVDNVPSGQQGTSGASDFAHTIDPGGRLTLTSGAPVATTDVSGASTVIYTPLNHNKVPLYDGSAWTLHAVTTELSQALSDATKSPAAAVDDKGYDMFIWLDAGTLRLSRGPAWISDSSRGGGTGTTELERVDGRFVNKYAISNGAAAQRGLYVGSALVNGADHGVTDSVAKRHLWNLYNRVKRPMRALEPIHTWIYSPAIWRQANGSSANEVNVFIGLSRESVGAEVRTYAAADAGSGNSVAVGIGINSSTVSSATTFYSLGPSPIALSGEVWAQYDGFPGIGRTALRWLEVGADNGTGTTSGFTGSVNDPAIQGLTALGITGHVFA